MFIKRAFQTRSPVLRGTQSRFHIRNRRGVRSQKGFTLIEIIVTLVLVGILAVVGGMAIVQAAKGYVMVKENSATTQKAQLAMSRITREIIEMINIPTNATNTVLPMRNVNGDRILGLNNGAVKIALDPATLANGDILIDNVNAFTLNYCSGTPTTCSATTWPAATDITTLTAIDVNLQVSQPAGGVLTFTNRIAPRNNKNQNGATLPPATPPAIPANWGVCFVATAAYGDAAHPMVQILRDFRDRYLLSWQSGRWFVKQYYEHGPAAADLIRNRPLAMWAVRCLLAPIVALSFCLLYAPLALPFIFFVSLILTSALFSAVRRGLPLKSGVFRDRGSILIGLIITMVIMATLAAAMLPLFSASYMNQAYADQGRKVYFLAESGYRYAASKFLNAGTAGRNAAMVELNGGVAGGGKTCNLLNNEGSFTTVVYPYWFSTQETSVGTTLTTKVYGTIPPEFTGTFSGGEIKVGDIYYSYTARNGSGTTITFSGLPAHAAIPATPELDVQPVTYPANIQTFFKGGSLTLSATGSGVFPVLNGNFILKGETYNYRKRTGTTLSNITKSEGTKNVAWTGSVYVTTTDKVLLDKFLRLDSTGKIGNASRMVSYNVPVGFLFGAGGFQKKQDIDNMNTSANWVAPTGGGTFSPQNIGGSNALKVDSTFSTGFWWTDTGNWAAAFFNGYSNTNLAKTWMDAGGFLSYDLQVKVRVADTSGNDLPYYFAGMNFRAMNNSGNSDLYTYGVSFVKARQRRILGNWYDNVLGDIDDIDDNLVPGSGTNSTSGLYSTADGIPLETDVYFWGSYRYSKPAIVFWKRTSTGNKIIAYRILTAADGIVTYNSSSYAYRLVDWSTLMVRVTEGYSLTFTGGGGTGTTGVPIREGDTITAGSGSARVVMTPILTGGSWAGKNAAGTLVLANVEGTFSGAEALSVNEVQLATAGTYVPTKRNYIRVYFTHPGPAALGTPNTKEINSNGTPDNNRLANARGTVNWPPDDLNDAVPPVTGDPGLNATNDYVTLVGWTGGNIAEMVPPLTEVNWTFEDAYTWNFTGGLRKDGTGTSASAQPSPALTIIPGVTYDVSFTVSNVQAQGLVYSLGGFTSGLIGAGSVSVTVTATTSGNLIFTPYNPGSRFTLSNISVRPRTALMSTSEPNAIIMDSDLTSPNWTSASTAADFVGPNGAAGTGDSIALVTSSGTATSTYYEDFAIQLDMKAGTGFLSPIQQ